MQISVLQLKQSHTLITDFQRLLQNTDLKLSTNIRVKAFVSSVLKCVKDFDDSEYTYMYDIGDSRLYSNNYTLPVGLVVNEDFMNIDIVENDDVSES